MEDLQHRVLQPPGASHGVGQGEELVTEDPTEAEAIQNERQSEHDARQGGPPITQQARDAQAQATTVQVGGSHQPQVCNLSVDGKIAPCNTLVNALAPGSGLTEEVLPCRCHVRVLCVRSCPGGSTPAHPPPTPSQRHR